MYVCRTLWEWVVRFPNKEVILAAAAAAKVIVYKSRGHTVILEYFNILKDQGLMIRSLVPEEPTGETDCSTYVLSQDNK